MTQIVIVMGVSGSGKTTVGRTLAQALDCPFFDADDFHPPANIDKMSRGIPLDDTDRAPWLTQLTSLIEKYIHKQQPIVLACSALKQAYRDLLRVGNEVVFVFLDGEFDVIWGRMKQRKQHFMQAEMLHSQFEALEPPTRDEAIVIGINRPIPAIITQILHHLPD